MIKKIILIICFSLISNFATAESIIEINADGTGADINSVDVSTNEKTLLGRVTGTSGVQASASFVDSYTNKVYISYGDNSWDIFDLNTNSEISTSLTTSDMSSNFFLNGWNGESIISTGTDAEDGSTTTILGSLDISDSNGNTLIENKADGSVHIGENSLVTQEVNGVQQLYATDSSGNRIDINIPSGTNLLIDGEDVMGSIDSSIALGAAFASLPTGAEGAGYTCGLGTGFHDSASAISGGCGFDFANYSFVDSMPEMFQKASFNIGAASVVHGEGDDATLKAGITFKFGAPKPVREAKDDNLLLENKIDAVMAKNEAIQAENDLLKAQIAEINTQLKALNMLAMN